MKRLVSLCIVLLPLLLLSFALPAAAQDVNSLIQIDVNAGFDSHFRGNMWMPLFIRVRNDGDAISGRLVVRPETSGSVVDNTFSTAIELPNGSRKSTLLYIVPSGFGTQVRVELIDSDGIVQASTNARIQVMQNLDQLYVVVTAAASGSVDMSGVQMNGYDAFQTNWNIENLPAYGEALQAVNVMLFSSIDTAGLTSEQRSAIGEWVAAGGHLIVTGGSNWRATSAGLSDLLPFEPSSSATINGLGELASWTMSGDGSTPENTISLEQAQAELQAQTLVATGNVKDGAEVLVTSGSTSPATPLLVRRSYGNGVIDYLTADPNTLPLRGWTGLGGLWYTLMSSRAPLPSWGYSYTNWPSAESATQIIPGFNLLPDTLALCGFLTLYIGLIGPLNYFILNKLNKREYAWFSIPALILIFSVVAWVTGFNLRGTDVTLNRMTVIQTWPDVDYASVDGLVGLLAPRRANYTLTLDDNTMLRTVPQSSQAGPFGGSLAGPDIQQGDTFRANNFPVDASFIAGFNTSGTMTRPDIGGQASLAFDDERQQSVRGAVSNNSEWTLLEPVILARGTAQRLNNALSPGDTVPFSFPLTNETVPAPGRVDITPRTPYYYSSYDYANAEQTILQILGEELYGLTAPYYYGYGTYYNNPNDPNWQPNVRRRAFLSSFLTDYFTSTGRGDRVYLVGWVDTSPAPLDVVGVSWRSQDVTLLITELNTEVVQPTNHVIISGDRFTWTVRKRENVNAVGPYNLSMYSDGEIIFRYTPLPTAVLSSVDRLVLYMDSDQLSAGVPLQLWNWEDGVWEDIEVTHNETVIRNPARYLGPQNAVEIRIFRRPQDLTLSFRSLWIEQQGAFE
ncbi:MAG: hypothetical protein U0694_23035 [Anaerolineae bacterium]